MIQVASRCLTSDASVPPATKSNLAEYPVLKSLPWSIIMAPYKTKNRKGRLLTRTRNWHDNPLVFPSYSIISIILKLQHTYGMAIVVVVEEEAREHSHDWSRDHCEGHHSLDSQVLKGT